MKLNIKSLKGQTFSIQVEPGDCFIDVKKYIHKQKGIPMQKQKLVYKGKAMQDGKILSDVGVKDQDNMISTKKIQDIVDDKKQDIKIGSQISQKDQKKQDIKKQESFQKNKQKLLKLGYQQKKIEEVLKKTNNNLQKALQDLTEGLKAQGKQLSSNQALRQQIIKALAGNQQLLQMNDNGQLNVSADLQSIANLLGTKNQQLQKLLLENPDALQELLMQFEGEEGQGDDQLLQEQLDEQFQNQHDVEVAFTQAQEQAIQRLMSLGFTRENVIPAYLACDKNQELAANMLFNQQENGDFQG